jgi:hypothetical protein
MSRGGRSAHSGLPCARSKVRAGHRQSRRGERAKAGILPADRSSPRRDEAGGGATRHGRPGRVGFHADQRLGDQAQDNGTPARPGRIPRPGSRTMSTRYYSRCLADLAPGLVDSCPILGVLGDKLRWGPGGSVRVGRRWLQSGLRRALRALEAESVPAVLQPVLPSGVAAGHRAGTAVAAACTAGATGRPSWRALSRLNRMVADHAARPARPTGRDHTVGQVIPCRFRPAQHPAARTETPEVSSPPLVSK